MLIEVSHQNRHKSIEVHSGWSEDLPHVCIDRKFRPCGLNPGWCPAEAGTLSVGQHVVWQESSAWA